MITSLTFEILLVMVLILFSLGLIATIAGILILTLRAAGKDVRTLATQTTRLAQKGLAEEVAGLVGNASALLEAVNKLVRTTAGVGVFLTVLGLLLMITASLLALKIY
ncbi:MAG: hypothetical protein JSV61_14270 [Anaerolineales bacterium]|nr:MAG: hypothetical protein JSV61_14270 [Anaerolineales bacterium]